MPATYNPVLDNKTINNGIISPKIPISDAPTNWPNAKKVIPRPISSKLIGIIGLSFIKVVNVEIKAIPAPDNIINKVTIHVSFFLNSTL